MRATPPTQVERDLPVPSPVPGDTGCTLHPGSHEVPLSWCNEAPSPTWLGAQLLRTI